MLATPPGAARISGHTPTVDRLRTFRHTVRILVSDPSLGYADAPTLTAMVTERSRIARVRRVAQRRGITVAKVRRVDPQALDYGLWHLDDPRRGVHREWLTLAQLETYLDTGQLPTE